VLPSLLTTLPKLLSTMARTGAGVEIGHGDVLFTLDLLREVTLPARGTASARNQKRFAVVCIGSRRMTRALEKWIDRSEPSATQA
jgi:hypothetical protein